MLKRLQMLKKTCGIVAFWTRFPSNNPSKEGERASFVWNIQDLLKETTFYPWIAPFELPRLSRY